MTVIIARPATDATKPSARAAAPSPALADDEPQPLDLHDLYHSMEACGYTRDLTLPGSDAQNIAADLRGIRAITAVLIAGQDTEQLELSDWLSGGLVDAIHRLAWSASTSIEKANNRAKNEQQQGGRA